jgi:hypothetical protein
MIGLVAKSLNSVAPRGAALTAVVALANRQRQASTLCPGGFQRVILKKKK